MRILRRVPEQRAVAAGRQPVGARTSAPGPSSRTSTARVCCLPRVWRRPNTWLATSCADLFLDTYPFNAGTTANDALWMGLPVLTRAGRTFASRMAGSLLTTLELPELITTTLGEYEERAVHLATQTDLLARLRQRLQQGREHSALFDMPRFVKDFETAVSSVALRSA